MRIGCELFSCNNCPNVSCDNNSDFNWRQKIEDLKSENKKLEDKIDKLNKIIKELI